MPYSTQSGVNDRFGEDNVSGLAGCWGDLDNLFNAATITANVDAAIADADTEIDSILRGKFAVPSVDADGATPDHIELISATLGGIILFERRGHRGERHSYSVRKDWVYAQLKMILDGDIDIGAVQGTQQ